MSVKSIKSLKKSCLLMLFNTLRSVAVISDSPALDCSFLVLTLKCQREGGFRKISKFENLKTSLPAGTRTRVLSLFHTHLA